MKLGNLSKTILLCFLCIALVACSNNNGNNTAIKAENAPNNAVEKDEAPITISWLSFNPPETDDSPVQKALEAKFNVKFKNIRVERQQYYAQMVQKIGAGEIPDVIYLEGAQQVADFQNQGVLADLPMDEIRGVMPEYISSLEALNPNLLTNGLVNGENYSIPLAWLDGELPFLAGYNKNWMDKLGYTEPPTTLDEFEELLRKMRDEDPDGNNAKDTIGYSAQGVDGRSFVSVYGAFQVRNDWMVDDNGTIYNGVITDNFREALKVLQRWYKDGLIDKEFITKNVSDAHDDFNNNKVGVRDWMSFQFQKELGIIGNQFYNINPNNEIMIGKPLEGPYGQGKAYSYSAINGFIALGKQVQDDPKKKQRILEILNALATDDETFLLAGYGVEGEHYDMVDGLPVSKEEYKTETTKLKIGAGLFYGIFSTKSVPMSKYESTEAIRDFKTQLAEGVTTMPGLGLTAPDVTIQYPELGTFVAESTLKFITGEYNLEGDFDKFRETFLKTGGQAITDAFNVKYKGAYKK